MHPNILRRLPTTGTTAPMRIRPPCYARSTWVAARASGVSKRISWVWSHWVEPCWARKHLQYLSLPFRVYLCLSYLSSSWAAALSSGAPPTCSWGYLLPPPSPSCAPIFSPYSTVSETHTRMPVLHSSSSSQISECTSPFECYQASCSPTAKRVCTKLCSSLAQYAASQAQGTHSLAASLANYHSALISLSN
jgi:hypothetical protein